MIVLGLTGSIGMGKSATAEMFGEHGVPVHSADAAVHRLYAGPAASAIEALFPGTVIDGIVDRDRLGARVLGDAEALKRLEALVHPLVRREETAFLDAARAQGEPLAVLDIPLLFETGGEGRVDKVLVVTAPADVQHSRVLARPGMSEARFEAILAKQMPDAEKRRRADFVIDTSEGFEAARWAVGDLVAALGAGSRRDVHGADGSREAPPSALPGISPSRGEIGSFDDRSNSQTSATSPISPPEGEMAGRPEGGASPKR